MREPSELIQLLLQRCEAWARRIVVPFMVASTVTTTSLTLSQSAWSEVVTIAPQGETESLARTTELETKLAIDIIRRHEGSGDPAFSTYRVGLREALKITSEIEYVAALRYLRSEFMLASSSLSSSDGRSASVLSPPDFDLVSTIRMIDSEPVEPGTTHAEESAVASILSKNGCKGLVDAVFEGAKVGRIADRIRFLGRLSEVDEATRIELVRKGLASKHIDLRDAAIGAAELWGDRSLGELVSSHREPTPWLAKYASRISSEILG